MGLGAAKKKKVKEKPKVSPPSISPALLPKWSPYAVGAIGIVAVILILLTAKGKD